MSMRQPNKGSKVQRSRGSQGLHARILERIKARTLLIGACLLLFLTACQPDPKTARGTAERFVNQYYVEINVEAAKAFCTGLALQKIQKEQQLTQGQTIDESTRKPTVHYRLLQKKEEPDSASYVFDGTITIEDGTELKRKWLITTAREGDQWKVSNFEDFE